MKERPILFNGPMVRAILEGRKTQTRRVVKPHPNESGNFLHSGNSDLAHKHIGEWRQQNGRWFGLTGWTTLAHADCPYGQPGDRLWVRETWQGPLLDSEEHEAQFRDDGPEAFKKPGFCVYRATDTLDAIDVDGKDIGWRPSIHMPRWASRILLEITDVRVERLQEISDADARAEGIGVFEVAFAGDKRRDHITQQYPPVRFADAFCDLWESINDPGSWEANPWVWVVEFKRVEGGAA